MCGILGWVTDTPSALAGGFDAMLSALGHRGPDDRGERVLAGGRVHLGHTRLAIIDLSGAGRQPMSNEDDSVWLVFNGEIYNHRALRPELEARGHRFKSRTDSEVILHAYEQWGDDCVARLRGIFAFAIWDERGQRLLAARDRLGVKPFYYWRYPGGFVFASEPKAILEHPRFERRLSMPAFQTFLAHRYVPGDLAIFDGMAKLPAAHRLTLEDQRLALEAYWQLDVTQRVTKADEAAELIAARLEAAVQRQLVSDAPVGILLSGGLDSSTVTALAVTKSALPTFTIGFEETSSDERQFARATREFFGCPGHERIVTLDDA
ncbi:MAG: asparagine synthase (glutamine-hydrolyzing), partial [bacterium]